MLKHIHDRSLLFGQVLGIMVIITLISISFFGLYSVRSAADQMGQGKDVVADILPPPLYLIESQLQVYTLLHAKPEEREALLQTLARLQQEFESRNRFWQESSLNEPLRELLLGEQKVQGELFWQLLNDRFVPAIKAGDLAQAGTIATRLHTLYNAHRLGVDATVIRGNEYAASPTPPDSATDCCCAPHCWGLGSSSGWDAPPSSGCWPLARPPPPSPKGS